MEKYKVSNRLVFKHQRKEEAFIPNFWYCWFLSIHLRTSFKAISNICYAINLQPSQTKTLKSIRTRGKHFCLIRMKPGSKDVTPPCSLSQWVAMMERRFANWLGLLSWANSHQNTQMTVLACTGMTNLFVFIFIYLYV